MNKNCYALKSPLVAARELGGEVVIMSAVDSSLFSLNEVASLIWKFADGTTPLHEIVETKICAEFDVDPELAYADAERLVHALAEHGMMTLAEEPSLKSAAELLSNP